MNDQLYQYARMQKAYYDETPQAVEDIVGNDDFHENFPYETHLLHRYGDIRRPVLADPGHARGFEIGCGEGRMVRHAAPPPASEAFLVDLHHVDRRHARWFENRWDAAATNSACDVAFGTADIPDVLEDFRRWFRRVEVWFHDLSIGRPDSRGDGRPAVLPSTHPNCHGWDDTWFTHMAFFHLREPCK